MRFPRKLESVALTLLLLLCLTSVSAAATDEGESTDSPKRRHGFSLPHVNLLPLASFLGLTTKPLRAMNVQQAQGNHAGPPHRQSELSHSTRDELTLLTFNVRYDNPLARKTPKIPGQDTTFPPQTYGEVSWSTRRHFISDTILLHNPDIFIFQEVLHNQLQDLIFLLGDDYAFVGVGRNDGKKKGEAVPVFWRKDRLELAIEQEGGTGDRGWEHFWLSDTPEIVGSVGWDADQTRMCTHVALRLRSHSKSSKPSAKSLPIHIFSTHYDHLGHVARAKSSQLILQRANDARQHVKHVLKDDALEPLVLLGGDLNSPREEKGWQNLVEGHHGIQAARKEALSFIDVQLAVPTRFGLPFPGDQSESVKRSAHQRPFQTEQHASSPPRGVLSTLFGPPSSFTDWNPGPRTRPPSEDRIDFWFMGDNVHGSHGAWKIKTAGTLSNWNQLEGGWRASDHRPVIARLRWEEDA